MRFVVLWPGGEVVSEDLGHKLEKTELTQLGSVKKVTVTKDDTIMLHGGGETDLQLNYTCCTSACRSISVDHHVPSWRTQAAFQLS